MITARRWLHTRGFEAGPRLPWALCLGVAMTVVGAAAHAAPSARADTGADLPLRTSQLPGVLKGVSIEQKPGTRLPLDARFTDQDGRVAPLSAFFRGRPV